jgi:hypothetical protein
MPGETDGTDRTGQQRVPKQRMVQLLGWPRFPSALALPYRDARSQHRPTSDPVPKRNAGCPRKLTSLGPAVCKGATPSRSRSRSSAVPLAVSVTSPRGYGPATAKEPCVAHNCFSHITFPAREPISYRFPSFSQKAAVQTACFYSFRLHNDRKALSHRWQPRYAVMIKSSFARAAAPISRNRDQLCSFAAMQFVPA